MRRLATDMIPEELTKEKVIEHLLDFAWSVYALSQDERLRGRAGAIINAYDEYTPPKQEDARLESRLLDDVG